MINVTTEKLLTNHKSLFNSIVFIVAIILFNSCGPKSMSYSDITSDIVKSIEKSDQEVIKTTLKDILRIDSVDKIYISYTQFGLPNAVWSNQKDFLNDMKLTVRNNEALNFSDTMTTFF